MRRVAAAADGAAVFGPRRLVVGVIAAAAATRARRVVE
jgi:hypothetical protein